jgi:hypothetical protein
MLTLKEFILEEKNEKSKLHLALKEYSDDPNIYFSFKPINTMSTNKNIYDYDIKAPIGIYCYNLKSAWSKLEISKKDMRKIPFSKPEKNIYLFSAPSSIKLVSIAYSEDDYTRDSEILFENYSEIIEDKDKLLKDSFAQFYNERIWLLTSNVAELTSDSNKSKKWSSIIKNDLEYDGFRDTRGTGYISGDEKYITLFVDKSKLDFIKKITI